MTEQQRQYAYSVGEEILQQPEGRNIKIYTSIELIRIQDTEHNENYRMLVVCKSDTEKTIRSKMLKLYEEMRKQNEK